MDASTRQVRMDHVALVVESLDRVGMGDRWIHYLGSGTASDSNSSSICRGGSLGRWSTHRDGHTVWDVADLSPVAARVESLEGPIMAGTDAGAEARIPFGPHP